MKQKFSSKLLWEGVSKNSLKFFQTKQKSIFLPLRLFAGLFAASPLVTWRRAEIQWQKDALWLFRETCHYRGDSVLQVKLEAGITSLYNQSQTLLKAHRYKWPLLS